MFRLASFLACIAVASMIYSPSALGQIADGVEDGDLFVGSIVPTGHRAIMRVRDGIVDPFSLGPNDAADPGFFDIPNQMLVDSQGRVVWTAVLGLNPNGEHVGLFRANGIGAVPERLAIFRVGNQALEAGFPDPFPDIRLADQRSLVGLHLARGRRVVIDDDENGGRPQVVTEDNYVMGLMEGDADGRTLAYGADSGMWDEGLPDPISSTTHQIRYRTRDMISHAGALYSIDDDELRRSSTPLRVDASGTIDLGPLGNIDFNLGLRLFGGDHDVLQAIVDNTSVPNVPSPCPPETPTPPKLTMPVEDGFIIPMSGFQSLAYDSTLGLVITSNYAHDAPYMTQISHTLLNDDPMDDLDDYFWGPGCLPRASLVMTRMFPHGQFSDPDSGVTYPVNTSVISAPGGGGLIGILNGNVIRATEEGAEIIASGINTGASSVAAYPTLAEPSSGLAILISINSSAEVLLTAPDGKQIGVDPDTGLPVNDFGENGFDNGPGELRFLGVRNAAPGDWSVQQVGTADGPVVINAYGIDLDQPLGDRAQMFGTSAIGSRRGSILRFDPAANVDLFLPGDYNLNGTVDAADYTVWRNSLGTTGNVLAADGDASGIVDAGDYNVWKLHYGESLPGSGAGGAAGLSGGANVAAPEPTADLLALSCIAFALVGRSARRGREKSSPGGSLAGPGLRPPGNAVV
jgi:hypothetical protein